MQQLLGATAGADRTLVRKARERVAYLLIGHAIAAAHCIADRRGEHRGDHATGSS